MTDTSEDVFREYTVLRQRRSPMTDTSKNIFQEYTKLATNPFPLSKNNLGFVNANHYLIPQKQCFSLFVFPSVIIGLRRNFEHNLFVSRIYRAITKRKKRRSRNEKQKDKRVILQLYTVLSEVNRNSNLIYFCCKRD